MGPRPTPQRAASAAALAYLLSLTAFITFLSCLSNALPSLLLALGPAPVALLLTSLFIPVCLVVSLVISLVQRQPAPLSRAVHAYFIASLSSLLFIPAYMFPELVTARAFPTVTADALVGVIVFLIAPLSLTLSPRLLSPPSPHVHANRTLRTMCLKPGYCYTALLHPHRFFLDLGRLGAYPPIARVAQRLPSFPLHAIITRHLVLRPRRRSTIPCLGALSDLLHTPLGTAACGPELQAYLARSRHVFLTPDAFHESLTPLAASWGIARNPHGKEHPHGLHKAVETKIHDIMEHAVRGRRYTLLSRKPLSGPLNANAEFVSNGILTGADLTRYPYGVFAAPTVTTPLAVVSDVLQNINPADVGALFERSPLLQHSFWSSVIAPEALTTGLSNYPQYYHLKRSPGGYTYTPEGHVAGAYFQPDSATVWLDTYRTDTSSGPLSVTRLESYGTHHLYLISRTQFYPEHQRHFPTADWVVLPPSLMPLTPASGRRARLSVAEKLVSFADRYPGYDVRDYHAKAAQVHAGLNYHLPYSEQRAAAHLAHHLRTLHTGPGSTWRQLSFLALDSILRFPVQPVTSFRQIFGGVAPFDCEPQPSLSLDLHHIDARAFTATSWTTRSWLPPVSLLSRAALTPLGIYATINFCLCSWVVPKLAMTHLLDYVFRVRTLQDFVALCRFWWVAISPTPARTTLFIIFTWLNVVGFANLPFSPSRVLRHAWLITWHGTLSFISADSYSSYTWYHFMAALFGVGNQHLFRGPGYTLAWQLFLSAYSFFTLFPHHPYRPDLSDPLALALSALRFLPTSLGLAPFLTHPSLPPLPIPPLPGNPSLPPDTGPIDPLPIPPLPGNPSLPPGSGPLNPLPPSAMTFLYRLFLSFPLFTTWFFLIVMLCASTTLWFIFSPATLLRPRHFLQYLSRPLRWPMYLLFLTLLLPYTMTCGFLQPRSEPLLLPLQNPSFSNLGGYGTFNPVAPAPAPGPLPPAIVPAVVAPPNPALVRNIRHSGTTQVSVPTGAGHSPGSTEHPYTPWFVSLTCSTPLLLRDRINALPPTPRAMDPNTGCFWICLSQLLGAPPEKLMCAYLATQWTDDIPPDHHVGLVSPVTMVRACTVLGVALSTRDAAGARVRADLLPQTPGAPGFPLLNLNVWHIAGDRADANGRPIDLFHVNLVDLPNFQPGPPPPAVQGAADVQVPALVGFTAPHHRLSHFAAVLAEVPARFSGTLDPFLTRGVLSPAAANYASRRPNEPRPVNRPLYNPLPVVPLVPTVTTYTPHRPTAEALASDLRDNPSIWLVRESDSTLTSSHKASCRYVASRTIRLTTFLGVPGCGKTHAAAQYLRGSGADLHDTTWVFPSPLVASDTMTRPAATWPLGPSSRSGQYTEGYEVFRKSTLNTLVIDDFTRFPPGTLDLLIFCNPELQHVVLTGDPAQSHSAFPKESGQTRALPSFGTSLMRAVPHASYCTVGRRTAPNIATLLGFTTLSQAPGDILFCQKAPPDIPLFVTSPRFAQTKTGGGAVAFVCSDSQGIDITGDCTLDLGGMTNTMLDGPALVGLTRSQNNVFLHFDQDALAPSSGSWGASTLLSVLVGLSASTGSALIDVTNDPSRLVASAFADHVRTHVPSLRAAGAAPPALIGFQDGVPSASIQNVTTRTAREALSFHYPITGPVFRAHTRGETAGVVPAPTGPTDPVNVLPFDDFHDNFAREARDTKGVTNQFPPHRHPGPPHRKRGDYTTERLSHRKRLRVASPSTNQRQFSTTDTSSRFASLKQGFTAVFPRFNRTRDFSALLDLCCEEVLNSWLSKRTLKAIMMQMTRDTVDWDTDQALVFLKSDVVRKNEKWNGVAGAGQSITEFPLQKTFRDAAYALLVEKVVLAECPAHVYIHLRRTTPDLQAWCARNLTGISSFTETDYTAWDSGVDAPFFKFDAWLLTQVGVPRWYIDQYLLEATQTRCFLGNLALGQRSGNRFTFLFNSLRNIALTNHTYSGLTLTPQAYGGDDSLLAGHPNVAARFDARRWPMQPKVVRTSTGHLFGHLVSNGVLSYDYEYMHHRLVTAITERPRDRDFFRSYIDQMCALPDPDSSDYAACYDLLRSHLHSHSLPLTGHFAAVSREPLSPDMLRYDVTRPEFYPKTWGGWL
jgi:hypothetical protein